MITSYTEEVIDDEEKKNLHLEDIFKDNDMKDIAEEFDWGTPVGNEVWYTQIATRNSCILSYEVVYYM